MCLILCRNSDFNKFCRKSNEPNVTGMILLFLSVWFLFCPIRSAKQFPYIYYVCYLFFCLPFARFLLFRSRKKIIFDFGLSSYLTQHFLCFFPFYRCFHSPEIQKRFLIRLHDKQTHTVNRMIKNCVLISKRFIVPSGYCFIIKFIFFTCMCLSVRVCVEKIVIFIRSFDLLLRRFRQFYWLSFDVCHFFSPKIGTQRNETKRKKIVAQNTTP